MLSNPSISWWWSVAGWTMLHYMWLGALIGMLAWSSKQALRIRYVDDSANVRYVVALFWLLLLAVAPIGLAAWVARTHPDEAVAQLFLQQPRDEVPLPTIELNASHRADELTSFETVARSLAAPDTRTLFLPSNGGSFGRSALNVGGLSDRICGYLP